ncbi:MAG: PH domain-containing protein [Polyangiales bacterium]
MAQTPSDLNLGPRRVLIDRHPFRPAALGLFALTVAATCALSLLLTPALVVTVYATPLVFAWWSATRTREAEVRVDDGALRFAEGTRGWHVPLDRIRTGYVVRGPHDLHATLELRGGDTLRIGARDEADARAVLTAVGRDVAQQRTVYRRRRIFYQLLAWMLAPVLGGFTASMAVPALASLGAAAAPLVVLVFVLVTAFVGVVAPPKLNVTLGRDGMAIGGALGTRFIPWSEVARVAPGAGTIEVVRRDGRAVSVWCNPDDPWVLDALVQNANGALATYRERRRAGSTSRCSTATAAASTRGAARSVSSPRPPGTTAPPAWTATASRPCSPTPRPPPSAASPPRSHCRPTTRAARAFASPQR